MQKWHADVGSDGVDGDGVVSKAGDDDGGEKTTDEIRRERKKLDRKPFYSYISVFYYFYMIQ